MCYYRRTIHICHHMSIGTLISACSRRPSNPNERCAFQWSRAIFTIRNPSKCRSCARIDGVLTSIAQLVTTSSLRMERVDDFKSARAQGREKASLAHQKPWTFWDTEDTRKGRRASHRSSLVSTPALSASEEGCISDDSDPEDHDGLSLGEYSAACVNASKQRALPLGSIAEEDDLDELEDIGYISIPSIPRLSI
ncbi:hypothetical protein HOO65_080395 [Ceratocystis lukuohia]|uniref:Uncharacterized protein n=1 Tax=Ceratocystis lukuohia TaxID=2019550 RepID=A0ABR4MAZ2_9PEZI